MYGKRGLLAFLCCVLACIGAVLHVPFFSGAKQLLAAFSDTPPPQEHPLLVALKPLDAPRGPSAPGAFHQLSLHAIRKETRSDPAIKRMASLHQIPFHMLKAHFAQISKGVLDAEGLFWVGEPKKTEEGPAAAEKASLEMARNIKDARGNLGRLEQITATLGEFRQKTGSVNGAFMAWTAGPQRAQRVISLSKSKLARDLESLRRHLIVPYRAEARRWLCTVRGLALTMQSVWPTRSHQILSKSMKVVRLDSVASERLLAPMQAQIGFVGQDGSRGICVEMVHACDLRTELCGLAKSLVKTGQQVHAGTPVGVAGDRSKSPKFTMWYAQHALDPTALRPPPKP